ncbi:MAG: phospholipid carrier-dependent glycosyltransferase [Chloroflexi bacterium]|nr:phospholipid carrier-dependent glycosyltransferase [Chloroflexota bacterium]
MRTALSRHRLGLALILAGFLVLATVYSLVTPLFEASDELWHYPMVKYLADHNFSLPVQDPATETAWRQEGGQPPLYYMIGALATSWIDTSDLDEVRRINPHADIGVVVPDGNVNMVVHDADREAYPWQGTVLAMRIVRFLSILMGLGTVYLTYRLGRELFPDRPTIALGAAAFTAFNPMFLFISAVINNDNLSTLLASLLLLLVVRMLKPQPRPPRARFYVLLGLAAGAGMLAKFQIGFILPLIALALVVIALRHHDWRQFIIGSVIAGGLTILIAGWWYWRNFDLYGDATGINVFLDIVGRRAVPADLRQLWTERETFMMAFWGFFGGVNLPLPDAAYTAFNLIALLAGLGMVLALLRAFTVLDEEAAPVSSGLGLARVVSLLWPLIIFLSLLSWTRQTWASQGRLWFSALAPLSVWMAFGLAGWSAESRRITRFNLVIAAAVFVALAIYAPLAVIHPAYSFTGWNESPEEQTGQRKVCFQEPDADDLALCATYQPLDGTARVGDYLTFSPTFTLDSRLTRDWSLFVHLVNADGLIEAQRDVYPGGGLLATSDLEPGDTWRNPIAVHLPSGLYTPQTLDVYLGFYDLDAPPGTRLIPYGVGADPDTHRVRLGRVRLETPPGEVPNPVEVQFEDRMRLLGYTVDDRSLEPGGDLEITLFWRALRTMRTDYVISVQIIQPETLVKVAQIDAPPRPPTFRWDPDTIIEDTRTLTIDPDAGPGRYRVLVRVYPADEAGSPLRIATEAGGQSEDFVWLSWIQVE